MKKNLIIAILAIISIASIIFGYTQKQKADEQEALAKELFEANKTLEKQAELEKKLRGKYQKKLKKKY
ncbi:MAG: hypothetical protein ACQETL_17740 [Bacteroidota bacterium]